MDGINEPYRSISRLIKKYKGVRTLREFAAQLSEDPEIRISYQSVKNWQDGAFLPDYFKMCRIADIYHDWRGDLALEIVQLLKPDLYRPDPADRR